jgi:hypothetical protein
VSFRYCRAVRQRVGIAAFLAAGALVAAGCGDRRRGAPRAGAPAAFCTAAVAGVAVVDVEADYLPHVIACENGAAGLEALKAQTVAARSYLYYRLTRSASIVDGTRDQVYSCGREPNMLHRMAVAATAGQVLQYRGVQVAAFFVAGALPGAPTCRGGVDDPTSTEAYVTYNQGRRGAEVAQTSLGFVDDRNLANRGCHSQNGASCLADAGWGYERILRFYYGEDIELVTATGACVPGSVDSRPSRGCSRLDSRAALAALLAALAIALGVKFLRPMKRTARKRRPPG